MTLYVNNSGSFIEPKEVFVKVFGGDDYYWNPVKEIYIKDSGVWRKIFPIAGSQTYSTAGTYSFVVPQGVYTLSMPVLSGGGGGGRSGQHTGDCHSGVAGSAGGTVASTSFATTPGETLTVIVGAGGSGGVYPGFQQGFRMGTTGGATYVKRGATTLYTGSGGAVSSGEYYSGSNFTTPGGTNGTGYGTGGTGGCCECNGGAGVSGVVQFSWS
jgi:hypothetical protein